MSTPNNNNFRWGTINTLGGLALALFLMLYGAIALIGIAIPAWVLGVLALLAGILILVGR